MVRLSKDTFENASEDWKRALDTLTEQELDSLGKLTAEKSPEEIERYLKENIATLSEGAKHFLLGSLRNKAHQKAQETANKKAT